MRRRPNRPMIIHARTLSNPTSHAMGNRKSATPDNAIEEGAITACEFEEIVAEGPVKSTGAAVLVAGGSVARDTRASVADVPGTSCRTVNGGRIPTLQSRSEERRVGEECR